MAETIIKVDLSKSAYDNDRFPTAGTRIFQWSPWSNRAMISSSDAWTGRGQIKNDDSAADVRDVDLSQVHFLYQPGRC